MSTAKRSSDIILSDFAMIAMKYANSARPTIAHPMTHFGFPMKGAQKTFVMIQGPMPMSVPFQSASGLRRLST
eukprot:CAMPEP_0197702198 /NCGR_PEP_ID=MMETSP1338-20131121/124217_1 /TAXON_ID=43686 ORGANISM="Pelagodinium beii, Strain RCC1491" /NCGR_SAMPLE_ID=MMETSP1338 /ASSEMBLY_ACC=CAM_ASM_000754 /LENGTH=72 /DNA_ID=CAMNT_0043285999 /DNA_START=167 /DNA_END=382 /DNA_ORIENTATION=-